MQVLLAVAGVLVSVWLILTVRRAILLRRDPLMMIAPDDPEMDNAIRLARESLPYYWARSAAPETTEGEFSLKVRIEDSHGVEHMWLAEAEPVIDMVRGIVNNTPHIVRSIKEGQLITVPATSISDWMFMRDGKIVGNYTMRARLGTLNASQRAEMQAMLAENPPQMQNELQNG